MNRKYAHYMHAYQSQFRLADSDDDVKLLTRAFESLSSVTTIMFGNSYDHLNREVKELLADAWCNACGHDLVKDAGAHLMRVITKALAASGLKLRHFLADTGDTSTWMQSECWSIDFAELSKSLPVSLCQGAFRHIVILRLERLYYSSDNLRKYQRWREVDEGQMDEDLIGRLDREISHSEDAAPEPPIEEMKRNEEKEHTDLALTRDGTTKALASILSSCPFIEELELCFRDDYRSRRCRELMPHIPLHKMLGKSNGLSKLRTLKLANCRMEEDQLVGTLLCCASTLEDLILETFILDRGTWESALNSLQGRFPRLSIFVYKYGDQYVMGHEMEALYKSYDIEVRHEYGLPRQLDLSAQKMLECLTGESAVNPMRAYMLMWAERDLARRENDVFMHARDGDSSESTDRSCRWDKTGKISGYPVSKEWARALYRGTS